MEKIKRFFYPITFAPTGKYFLNAEGKVFADAISPKEIKGTLHHGYRRVHLTTKQGPRRFYVHKLIAQAFCDKQDPNQTQVIHLDYDKQNNDASNLQWATPQEAKHHLAKRYPEFNRKSPGRPPKKSGD